MNKLITLALVIVSLISYLRCSTESPLAGNTPTGSETTNGITATVHYPDGTPAANLAGTILPANHLSLDSGASDGIVVNTDSLGRVSVHGLESRKYTLEILTDTDLGVMIPEIDVAGQKTMALGSLVLDTVGYLSGSIRTQHIDSTVRLLVAPYGISRPTTADSDGGFRFDKLAPGSYQLHVTSTSPHLTGATDLRGTVEPSSGTHLGRTSLPIDYRHDSVAVHAYLRAQGLNLSSFDWSQRVMTTDNRIGGLDLCSLGIAEVHSSIQTLDFVTTLKLSHNPLRSLPGSIGDLNILNLSINDAGMSRLFPEILDFENLILLSARNNQLTHLPDELSRQKDLRVFYLDGNAFTEFPKVFLSMSWLTDVNLSGNQIASLPDTIARYPRMWHLNVSGNKLIRLPDDIAELAGLEVFEAARNALTSFPERIDKMNLLRTLSLSGNSIDSVPASIGGLSALDVLHLADNRISALPDAILEISPITFTIRNNVLCDIPQPVTEWIEKYSTDYLNWRESQDCN